MVQYSIWIAKHANEKAQKKSCDDACFIKLNFAIFINKSIDNWLFYPNLIK